MGDKDYLPPNSTEDVHREMCRCVVCKRWQSTDGSVVTCGACGGRLELVDMVAHGKTLTYVPYDPAKDPNRKKP